jgi:hypothetical protein
MGRSHPTNHALGKSQRPNHRTQPMISSTYTITPTASKIVAKSDSTRSVYVHVTGNGTVYIGGADVTTSNGLATQKHTTPIEFVIPSQDELWAVIASGTEDLRIMISKTKSGDA